MPENTPPYIIYLSHLNHHHHGRSVTDEPSGHTEQGREKTLLLYRLHCCLHNAFVQHNTTVQVSQQSSLHLYKHPRLILLVSYISIHSLTLHLTTTISKSPNKTTEN